MKEDEANLTPAMEVAAYTQIEHKPKKVERTETSNSSDQHKTKSSNHAICIFPLQYILDEHVTQAFHDTSDDNIYIKIWLTYCKDPALKNTLRSIYHDHCYSDIPKLECTDLVDVPEPSYNDYNDLICNSELLYNIIIKPSLPSHTVQSSDVGETNIFYPNTDSLSECVDTGLTSECVDTGNLSECVDTGYPTECVDTDSPTECVELYDMIHAAPLIPIPSYNKNIPRDIEDFIMKDEEFEKLHEDDQKVLQWLSRQYYRPRPEFESTNTESNTDSYGKF